MKFKFEIRSKVLLGICCSLTVFIVILQLFLHNKISPTQNMPTVMLHTSKERIQGVNRDYLNINDMKDGLSNFENSIRELKKIKTATLNELQSLSQKHFTATDEIKKLSTEKVRLSEDIAKLYKSLMNVKRELRSLQSAFAVKKLQFDIPIAAPKHPVNTAKITKAQSSNENSTKLGCSFSSCFDYSRCPILSQFKVYIHKPTNIKHLPFVDMGKSNLFYNEILKMPFYEDNPNAACIFVAVLVIDSTHPIKDNYPDKIVEYFKSLNTWRNNGQNHLLFLLNKKESSEMICEYFKQLSKMQAVIITPTYCEGYYRDNFDGLLFPNGLSSSKEESWSILPSLVPIKRSYLFVINKNLSDVEISEEDIQSLKGWVTDVYIHTKSQCITTNCQDVFEKKLQDAVFNLLFNIRDYNKLIEGIISSFKHGAIPVIIGDEILLPFQNVIDYRRALLTIPQARVTETNFILRTMKKIDVFSMKKQGRFLFETYFSSLSAQIRTIFAIYQHHIKLPPTPLPEYRAKPLYKSMIVGNVTDDGALKSAIFNQNWTISNVNCHQHWNTYPGGHYLLPYTPNNDALPSSVQFSEDVRDYMPIGNGKRNKFANSLGGDKSVEHFTIIILTYNREMILLESLQRLSGLKYLNRVLVIWNNPARPTQELDWPDIGVPIHVVKAENNSLNNRFLPYDLIDTEAVLSMDDDIYLREDEIELAFRVWRENRDRIVGFPGRYHSWDGNKNIWTYDANVSCELSMVLTGGAFFHKYYSYLYTHIMPSVIRTMVDDYMNCEDIAMNFLVSHITNKPPIKVTSRWTFRCPGCPTSLSSDDSHYVERTKCLNFFKTVYGYMPLKRTQFRADSVLFKTRLPLGKQKCYRFV